MRRILSEKRNGILAIILAFAMLFSIIPLSVTAETAADKYLAVTSDVHDAQSNVPTWLTNNSGNLLDYMVFGGDYSYSSAQASVITALNTAIATYPNIKKPIYTMGNHDYDGGGTEASFKTVTGFDRTGIQNTPATDGYTVYTLGAANTFSGSTQSFPAADLTVLTTALAAADPDEPFFIVSHFPLHYGDGRTTTNAGDVVTLLNNYPNVFFFWGHNHHSDPQMGTVKVAGETITLTSSGTPVQINFTYSNSGCMSNSSNMGVLVKIAQSSENTTVDLSVRNMNGTIGTTRSVTVSGEAGGGETPGGGTGETMYQLASAIESGETYVVVARSGNDSYALKANFTDPNHNVLPAVQVAVITDNTIEYVDADDVTPEMLWKFTTDGNGFDVMNGSYYMNRRSSQGSPGLGLYVSTTEGAASYSDWLYNASKYLYSVSQGGNSFLIYNAAGNYFTCSELGGSGQAIYLYKMIEGEGPGGEDTAVENPAAGSVYRLVQDIESGSTYIIVSKTPANPTALTTTAASTNYLAGTQVTIISDAGSEYISAAGVNNNMLWTFTPDGNGFDVMNGSSYLNRRSGSGLQVSTTEAAAQYSDWMYNASKYLYTYSTSASANAYLNYSTASSYFTSQASNSGQVIYLYKSVNIVNAEKPVITAEPQDGTYAKDTIPADLSVQAAAVSDGGTLSYQWYSNTTDSNTGGTLIPSATSATYTPPTDTEGTLYYYVAVINTNNTVNGAKAVKTTSSAAEIIITASAPAVKLDTPTGLTWDGVTGKATWAAVTNASGYSVQLYKDSAVQGSPVSAASAEYNFAAVINETGTYTFKVTAIGNGTEYTDSDQSASGPDYDYTKPAIKLGTPADLAWDGVTGKATWSAVTNASGYSVQLYKDSAVQGSPVSAASAEYNFAAVINETGTYTFKVTAIGDGTVYSNSDQSASSPDYDYTKPAMKLDTPAGLTWDGVTGKATWTAVTNASGYSVQLYKDSAAQGSPVTAASAEYSFAAVITETGTYTFKVTAIGDGTVYSNSDQSASSPDYSFTELTITTGVIIVSEKATQPGKTVSVPITIDNNPGIIAMRLKVIYDQQYLTLDSVDDGGILGDQYHSDEFDSPYTLYWNNPEISSDITATGIIATLNFTVDDETPEGIYTVSVEYEDFDILNYALNDVFFDVTNGKIDISDFLLGDLDGDGEITLLDITKLARYLGNWQGYGIIDEFAADVDKDGLVTPRDLVILQRHFANWVGYEELPYLD